MKEVFGGIFAVLILMFAVIGVVFVGYGSFDDTIVRQCEKHGYWQTGQIRVVCSVEGGKQ